MVTWSLVNFSKYVTFIGVSVYKSSFSAAFNCSVPPYTLQWYFIFWNIFGQIDAKRRLHLARPCLTPAASETRTTFASHTKITDLETGREKGVAARSYSSSQQVSPAISEPEARNIHCS